MGELFLMLLTAVGVAAGLFPLLVLALRGPHLSAREF